MQRGRSLLSALSKRPQHMNAQGHAELKTLEVFLEDLRSLAQCSRSCSKDETRRIFLLCAAGKALLKERAACWAATQLHQPPLLCQYSVDLTPVTTTKHVSAKSGTQNVRRAGKSTDEFLCQQVFVTTLGAGGEYKHTLLYPEPQRLEHGKTMAALLACAKLCPGIRLRPAESDQILIRHQVHDRGVSNSFLEALSGWWSKEAAAPSMPPDSIDMTESSSAFSWHTAVGCACHDGHNSLKWAHHALFGQESLLEDVYVSVSAIKSAYYHSTDTLGSWLASCVQAKPSSELPSAEHLYFLWVSLGVEQSLARELADMRVLWHQNDLCVEEDFLGRKDALETLSTCLLATWRFQKFTSSRWCTMGSACRCLSAAVLTGYWHLLKFMREQDVITDFTWHGIQRLNQAALEFVFVVGLSAYVSETFLLHVLKDGRVARIQEKLQTALFDEFDFLDYLPTPVWELLARGANMPANDLRNKVVAGGLISWAFLESKVLVVAASLPWRLCKGDIAANISDLLQAAEPPEDTVASKIFHLGSAGFNRLRLQRAVGLLGSCSWTSALTERQHASTSLVKKYHPDIGSKLLTARAYLHTFLQLLPGQTAADKRKLQLKQRLERFFHYNPNRITGRQLYLAQIMHKATIREEQRNQKFKRRKIMQLHGAQWKQLSSETQQNYERRARVERSAALQRRQGEMDAVQTELLEVAREAKSATADTGSMLLSACRLDHTDLRRLQDLAGQSQRDIAPSKAKAQDAAACPLPVSAAEMEELRRNSEIDGTLQEDFPEMFRVLCRLRDHFSTAVFQVSNEGGMEFYRFLFAMQSPYKAFFLQLQLQELVDRGISCSAASFDEQWFQDVPWCWTFVPGNFATANIFRHASMDSVGVIMHTMFAGRSIVQSRDVLQPLEPIVKALLLDLPPRATSSAAVSPTGTKRAAEPELLRKHPWLASVLSSSSTASAASGPHLRDGLQG